METYTLLREFADSWALLALTLFYLGTMVWAFRPGTRALHDEISRIPLRDDTHPDRMDGDTPAASGDASTEKEAS